MIQIKLRADSEKSVNDNFNEGNDYAMLSLEQKALNLLLSSSFLAPILRDIGLYLMGNFMEYDDYNARMRGQRSIFNVVDSRTNTQYEVDMEKVSLTYLLDLQNQLAMLKKEVEQNGDNSETQ